MTDDEVGRLEDVADLTGLELALAAIDPDGAESNGVAEAWARVRDAGNRHPASPPADRQRTAEVG